MKETMEQKENRFFPPQPNIACFLMLIVPHFFLLPFMLVYSSIHRHLCHIVNSTTQEETRRRSDNNGPMKLEVQVQPSVKPPQSLTGEHIGTVSKTSSSSSTFDPYQTRNSQFDPNSQAALATAIFHQQQHINSLPTFGPTEFHGPPNIFDQQFDQQMNYPYGLPPGLPPSEFSPFEGGYLRQMQTQPGPIFGFFANLAQHNPVTNFLNQFNPSQQQQQTTTQNTPILNLLSNLNPLNLLNNNNNNRPTVTIPTVTVSTPSLGIQSDYVMTSPSPSGQLVAYPSVPTSSLSGNIDNSVFSYNEQFFNPNSASAQFNYPYGGGGVNYGTFGNFQPSSSIYSPQQYPSNSYLNQFTQTTNRPFQTYPNGNFIQPNSYLYGNSHRQNPTSTFYQNPYQTNLGSPIIAVNPLNYYGNRRKPGMSKNGSATKKKNNKTKVEIDESGSAWFQDFLNQRKQTSLGDVTTVKQPQRPTKAKPATSDEDNDSSGLEDYFR